MQRDDSDRRASRLPVGRTALLAALVCVAGLVLAGNLTNWKPGDLFTQRPSAHALAVMPVLLDNVPDDARWLAGGGQVLLQQVLQAVPEIRLLEMERVNQSLELLQIDPAGLREPQARSLARMMGADYLLRTRISHGDGGYRVRIELLNRHAGPLAAETLADSPVAGDALRGFLTGAAELVRKALSVQEHPDAETLVWIADGELYARASEAARLGQLAQAEELLGELLQAQVEFAPGWLLLARVQRDSQQPQAAAESLHRAITNSRPGSPSAYLAQARSARLAGDVPAAEIFLRRLIEQFPNDISARMELSELLMEQGLYPAAHRELRALVALDPEHPRGWYLLSRAAIISGESAVAVKKYLPRALAIHERLQDAAGRGDLLNAFGAAYQRLGQLPKAEAYFGQALKVRREEGDRRGSATTFGNLAALHSIRGEIDAARTLLQQALGELDGLEHPESLSDIHNQMGILEEEEGNYRDALAHYREALALRMTLEDVWLRAESKSNVGFMYFLLSDYDHALVYWNQARHNYRAADDAMGLVHLQQQLAQLEIQRGNWPRAFQLLQDSLNTSRAEGLVDEEMVAGAFLGRLAFLQGRFRAAEAAWESALRLVQERRDYRGIIEFGLWQVELTLALGQYDLAAQRLAQLRRPLESHAGRDQRVFANLLGGQVALARGDGELAQALLETAGSEINPDVPVPLQLRAETLAAQLGAAQLGAAQLDQVAGEAERNWRAHPLEYLQWLEVRAVAQRKAEEWAALEETLALARPVLDGLESYWRSYIFELMAYDSARQRGDASAAARGRVGKLYAELEAQVPEKSRASFRLKNPPPSWHTELAVRKLEESEGSVQ